MSGPLAAGDFKLKHYLRRQGWPITSGRWLRLRSFEPSGVARDKARALKREVHALYFAVRDPRVPWYAKALAACVVGYALSPIDLIPDFIPVLGYLDELFLLPLGVLAVRAMIPASVLVECREKAAQASEKPTSRLAAGIIIAIWLLVAAASGYWLSRWISN